MHGGPWTLVTVNLRLSEVTAGGRGGTIGFIGADIGVSVDDTDCGDAWGLVVGVAPLGAGLLGFACRTASMSPFSRHLS